MSDVEYDRELEEAQEKLADEERLDNSKLLDVHTWSDHPEVNAFVDPLYENYFKGRKEKIRRQHLKVVLLDLYVTWTEYRSDSVYLNSLAEFYKWISALVMRQPGLVAAG